MVPQQKLCPVCYTSTRADMPLCPACGYEYIVAKPKKPDSLPMMIFVCTTIFSIIAGVYVTSARHSQRESYGALAAEMRAMLPDSPTVTAEQMGQLRLGMAKSDVINALGQPAGMSLNGIGLFGASPSNSQEGDGLLYQAERLGALVLDFRGDQLTHLLLIDSSGVQAYGPEMAMPPKTEARP